jgi:hypothetical protein
MQGLFAFVTVITFSIAQLAPVWAFETDQFNLPPVPLADIGSEVEEYTAENIRAAVIKINKEIEKRQNCVSRNPRRTQRCEEESAERLTYLRSGLAVAREVYKRLGFGIIAFAKAGSWMDSHRFRAQPARYRTSYRRSIYASLPTNYLTISPTVNLYGSSIGTDKIAHFFQQGYTYYRIFNRELAKGSTEPEAIGKAVGWGRMTEHTYYGTLVGGVFSNADLAANYAGMKFYEGLTKPVMLGKSVRPPTLILKEGKWTMNEGEGFESGLLRPFISDHLNEALNPSVFAPGLRSSVRGVVRKQSCAQWIALFPNRTKSDFEKISAELSLWNGESYGFRPSDKSITIAGTCFESSAASTNGGS